MKAWVASARPSRTEAPNAGAARPHVVVLVLFLVLFLLSLPRSGENEDENQNE